jgi:hypothetical protein
MSIRLKSMFNGESPKGFPSDLLKAARRKLRYLNAAANLIELRAPPGNLLEALKGDPSTISAGSAFCGRLKAQPRSRLRTTTEKRKE